MNKGVALYLAVVVMALLLIIVFGLSMMVRNQIKMIGDAEKSVLALYAADSGIEQFLVVAVHNTAIPHGPNAGCTDSAGNVHNYCASLAGGGDPSYYVDVKCCKYSGASPTPGCLASAGICGPLSEDVDCGGKFYCAKSVGTYHGTIRGVSVSI
jgi:hypothetical protein